MGDPLKYSDKYKYITGTQITDHGSRVYEIQGARLPSVPTILAKTKDQAYLQRWKNKVGHEEAERIKNYSSKRGTSMHKFLEKHITGKGYDDLTEIGKEAKPMAQKIIEIGLVPISEWYGSEIMIHYPGLYAGSTDLACLHNDMETIIDFKQANRPKNPEWIEDYYLQLAAYICAHEKEYGEINGGTILMASTGLVFQEFDISGSKLDEYKDKWWKRLDDFKTNHGHPRQESSQKV